MSNSFTEDSIEEINLNDDSDDNIDISELIVDKNDKNNKDYICPVCKDFMLPDVCSQLSCGHLFCENCVKQLNSDNFAVNFKCPLCNVTCHSYKKIKKNNLFAYNILSNVDIYCPHKDCKQIIKAGSIKDHMKYCDFEKIDCPYCDEKNIYRKDLKKHLIENMEDHFLKLIDVVESLKKKIN